MGAHELNKLWDVASAQAIALEMSFEGDFLVLGAQTRLAEVGAAPDESRLVALLAAAHGRPIASSPLNHIQRALEKKQDGDLVLALIHLALSGLSKLRDPKEDARRLFMADALMAEGVQPLVIVKGLGLGQASFDEALDKYSADQPRVSAGNPDGGQWTSGDWPATTNSPPPQRPADAQVADAPAARDHVVLSDPAPAALPRSSDILSGVQLAEDYSLSCEAYIAANRQARILRVFPGQFLKSSVQEVIDAAKAGDVAARRACKLLFDNRWAK